MKSLLEAGAHFGHQTRRWDPRMRPFIFTQRNGIHIIDLQQTVRRLEEASEWVADTVSKGGTILFVGTKKQAQETIQAEANRCGMPYVNSRWLGGTLTNFTTIQGRIDHLVRLEDALARGEFNRMPKKDVLKIEEEIERLNRHFGGIKEMTKLPAALYVVDPSMEYIAIAEANRCRHPDRRHGRHELQPEPAGLPHPVQRRRHSRRAPGDGPHRRRRPRGPAAPRLRRRRRGVPVRRGPERATALRPTSRLPALSKRKHRQPKRNLSPARHRSLPRLNSETLPATTAARRRAHEDEEEHVDITLDMIKSLRERSGAGIMDCKRALEASEGNEDKAMQFLLEAGIASAGKKAARETSQGLVESYIHGGGRIGVIVEVACETDFVARTPDFQTLAKNIAMQIAAMNPLVVSEEQIPRASTACRTSSHCCCSRISAMGPRTYAS